MKNKKTAILVVVVFLICLGLAHLYNKNKPIDWSPTFFNSQKKPYDTYITYNLLKDIFPKGKIESSRSLIYNNLSDADYYDDDWDNKNDSTVKAYIFINSKFEISNLDLEYLLDFVDIGGNNVFISAESFSKNFLDSLKINTQKQSFFSNRDTANYLNDYPDKKYSLKPIINKTTINVSNTPYKFRVLGHNQQDIPNFIRIEYGDGYFYLHTMPVAFTNVKMLNTDQYDYGFRALSYLPRESEVIWDESQKQYPLDYRNDNIFKVIWRYPPLRAALLITLLGIALYMLFRSKRIQRIIPIVKPPKNSSLEFLDTISNLYFIKNDYQSIAENRYNFFLDTIRTRYYLRTEHIDNEFIQTLSLKSNVDIQTVERLFELYSYIHNSGDISNQTFISFNQLLEEFYRKSK